MVLASFLHQHSQGEELVSTSPTMTETTLTFSKELFCSGLESVQDGSGKHLTRYDQKSNTTIIVITDGTASFLMQGHEKLTLLIPRN